MARKPEEYVSSQGGPTFRQILIHTIDELNRAEAGYSTEVPQLVATTHGMLPILPANVEFIREDIQTIWGTTMPELFGGSKDQK